MMTAELGVWHEVSRKLHDGTYLRVSPVNNRPDLVFVIASSASGYQLFSGTMSILDALVEIPYLLDRARVLEDQILEANNERREDAPVSA